MKMTLLRKFLIDRPLDSIQRRKRTFVVAFPFSGYVIDNSQYRPSATLPRANANIETRRKASDGETNIGPVQAVAPITGAHVRSQFERVVHCLLDCTATLTAESRTPADLANYSVERTILDRVRPQPFD